MAWTTPGTATAGEVLTAAFWNEQVRDNLNSVARGVVAYESTSTQTSLSTTLVDVSGLSVTWEREAGKNYLVAVNVTGILKQTNAGFLAFQITDASNTVKSRWYRELALNETFPKALLFEWIINASAGSATRKVRQQVGAAGGVFNRGDIGDNLDTFIAVIDLGGNAV